MKLNRQGVRDLNTGTKTPQKPPREHKCRHWRAEEMRRADDDEEGLGPPVAPIYRCVTPGCTKTWP